MTKRDCHPGVEAAIAAAGGGAKLGKILGVTRSAVSGWVKIPVHHVLTIEKN